MQWSPDVPTQRAAILGYKAGFIDPISHPNIFTKDMAIRVNMILSLYEDRLRPQVQNLASDLKEAYGHFERGSLVILPDPKGWHAAKINWAALDHQEQAGTFPAGTDTNIAALRRLLWAGYQGFLLPAFDAEIQRASGLDADLIFDTHDKLFKSGASLQDLGSLRNFDLRRCLDDATAATNSSANSAMSLLTNADFAAAHAELLFLTNALETNKISAQLQARSNFVVAVVNVASNYFVAREGLAGMLRALEEIVRVLDQRVTTQPQVEAVANYAARLVDPEVLLGIMKAARDGETNVPAPVQVFEKAFSKCASRDFFEPTNGYLDSDGHWDVPSLALRTEFRATLAKCIAQNPTESAEALQAADQFCRSHTDYWGDTNKLKKACVASDFRSDVAREFGLARRPTIGALELLDITALSAAISETSGFAHGRLDEGIQTLIDQYLYAKATLDANDPEIAVKQDRLLQQLVHFGEKVAFIANNETLLSQDATLTDWLKLAGWSAVDHLTYGESMFWRLLGNTNPPHSTSLRYRTKKAEILGEIEDAKKARPYTQVLQAIGNSILVQVDEIKHRQEYDRTINRTRLLEMTALTNAGLSKGFETNLVRGEGGFSPGDRREVLDLLIATLRERQIDLLASPNTNGANTNLVAQYDRAIELIQTYRSGMVYLRPPSAYLRSSYPASSLQRNNTMVWENMLERQAMRSLPFMQQIGRVPIIGKWYNVEDLGPDAKAIREVDKQFWQNINRIRVAASGESSYAIVKDGIGNWYVKSYVGDPSPIIEGAASVMTYASGGSAVAVGKTVISSVTNATLMSVQPSLLQKQIDHFQNSYLSDTKEQAGQVLGFATNLFRTNTWVVDSSNAANLTSLSNLLDRASNRYYATLQKGITNLRSFDSETNATLLGKRTDALLKQISEMNQKVIAVLTNTTDGLSATNKTPDSLPEFSDILRARCNSVQTFQQAMKTLRESLQP